jgi:predicted dehydrogenase
MNLGIGIVGSGAIAEVHAACIEAQSNAHLAGILTRSKNNAKSLAEKFNIEVFTDSAIFYSQTALDAVCICNESGLHGKSILQAIEAKKHILSEKPLETTLSKIDSIIDKLNGQKISLGVVFQNRMNPNYIAFKKTIQSGKLGEVLLVNTQVNWYRDDNYYKSNNWRGTIALDGGAALINQSIHTLDLLIDLMGAVRSVGAQVETKTHDIEGEDLAVAHLTFQSGALGTLSAGTCLYPGYPESITVYGTKGNMVFEGGLIRSCSLPEWKPTANLLNNLTSGSAKLNSIELHQAVIDDFIKSVLEDKEPLVNAKEARKSVALIEAIYKASEKKQIIKLELS